MINVEIIEESVAVLPEYRRIPISFEVRSVFELVWCKAAALADFAGARQRGDG